MKAILAIALGVFITQTLTAQNDSLIIKLNDYGQLLIVNSNLVTKKIDNRKLDETYSGFYQQFEELTKIRSFEKEEGYFIKFTSKSSCEDCPKHSTIQITQKNKTPDKYFFYKDQIGSLLDYKYKVSLSPKTFLFLDSINDFAKVSTISLDSLYKQSKKEISPDTLHKRQAHLFFFDSNNGKLNDQPRLIYSEGKAQDYIMLYTGFGAQIINSSFAPQVDIIADVAFNKKNTIPGQKFGISATFLFMPDEADFHNINTYNFANVSYYLKFNQKWSHKISVGYLFAKNGEHFSNDTWCAFWQSNIKDIGVKIGTYYTKNSDGDYVTIPSFGVSISF